MIKTKVRHIDFYPDEYIAGVGGVMTAEQQGVYWMICALISSHGGDVENDPKRIGRLVCLGSSKTRRIISELVESGKINEKQSKLSQKRIGNEVKKARNRIETATKNGSVPKKNNALTEAGANSPAKLTTNHQPPTTKDTPNGGDLPSPDKALFDYGKSVLGAKSGGQIAKLKKAFGVEKAHQHIEDAAKKSSPSEWIGRVLANNDEYDPNDPLKGMLII